MKGILFASFKCMEWNHLVGKIGWKWNAFVQFMATKSREGKLRENDESYNNGQYNAKSHRQHEQNVVKMK